MTFPLPNTRFFRNPESGIRGAYRYGFNGKELDKEGMGGGATTYDYGFRIYNAALAKFLSVDPLSASYPWYTPYQFAGNKPIIAIDLDGLEEKVTIKPNPNVYNETHFKFLNNQFWVIYKKAISKGCSIHGALFVCAMAWNESGQGTSEAARLRNNYFGIGGGSSSFSSLEENVDYFFNFIGEKWPTFLDLLKSPDSFSSDDVNRTTNSGPYTRPYDSGFKNSLSSYNYDPDNSEPTKVLRDGIMTGMEDYGQKNINTIKTAIGAFIVQNMQAIKTYETWIAYDEGVMKNPQSTPEQKIQASKNLTWNKAKVAELKNQNEVMLNVVLIIDTGNKMSPNCTNQDKEQQVKYGQTIKEIGSNE